MLDIINLGKQLNEGFLLGINEEEFDLHNPDSDYNILVKFINTYVHFQYYSADRYCLFTMKRIVCIIYRASK